MSAYRGRTGPNFSEFLSNLNSLSPYDEETFATEALDVDSDLAMFTNTDFTHFDIPSLPEETGFGYDMNGNKSGGLKYQDLLAGPDPQGFHPTPINTSPAETPQYYSNYNTPIQPNAATGFPNIDRQSTLQSESGPPSRERKTGSVETDSFPPEDKSRVAAEEDKRRRNTAASARFRVKKKQREQALERNVKDVADKNSKLEARLNQLEMENKWLKDLITEKNNHMQSKEEIDEAFQKFKRESEEREVRTEPEHTTGVGTQ